MKSKINRFPPPRADFPIFKRHPNLVYLDSSATSLKPHPVLKALVNYYADHTSNIHRGLYPGAQKTDRKYELARHKIAKFLNVSPEEIVFTRNATESANLVAYSWALNQLKSPDEIITTVMEHHANLVTWQQVAQKTGARLKFTDITPGGLLDLNQFKSALNSHTKLVAFTHVSNVLGTINPVQKMIKLVRQSSPQAKVLIDGAQAVPHMPVNLRDLDCDFYIFSGHKMTAPTGIGILFGKKSLLTQMPPFMVGGDMIKTVTLKTTTFADPPTKFEAGTPHIAGVLGLGAAVDYLSEIGMEKIRQHEKQLVAYAIPQLAQIQDLTLYGPTDPEVRGGVLSFSLKGIHPHDLGQLLGEKNIAIRAGHHCAMPLHEKLGVPATARASLYLYNDTKDIDALIKGIKSARKTFNKK